MLPQDSFTEEKQAVLVEVSGLELLTVEEVSSQDSFTEKEQVVLMVVSQG